MRAVSNPLVGLGKQALELGIDSVRVGRPFGVFAIRVSGDDDSAELFWYFDADDERAANRARRTTATSECKRYAVVLHEEIRDREGVKRSAIVAEVGDRDHEQALRMGQPYVPFGGPGQPLETLGNPMMLGDTTNVLRGSTVDPGKPASFVVVCPGCSKKNRVSIARVRDRLPKCGSCGNALLST